jgi:TRAP-type C4-dicarboxylate transport system permease small subunit
MDALWGYETKQLFLEKEVAVDRPAKLASSFFDTLLNIFAALGGAILAFLLLSVCWDVIARSVARKPLPWVEEFTEYGLLFMCFLCTAWVLKTDKHVVSDLLLVSLSKRTQALLNTLTSIAGGLVCLVLTYFGWVVAWNKYKMGSYQPTIMQPPDFPIFLIIPIGFILLSIQFARRTSKYFNAWKAWKTSSRDE